MGKPIPESLIAVYIFFVTITILLVMTSTKKGAEELAAPLRSLALDPERATLRAVIIVAVPLIATAVTYDRVRPGLEAPAELRSTHPAPPATFRAYGKTFELATLENPFRRLKKESPDEYTRLVREGGDIYFKNCFFCHGDKLDGRGHYAQGVTPQPLPFTGTDTIAQLQESFVFWRVATGGQGLPKEATPWLSAMPAWQEVLTEEEIWKTILFIYDYTGNLPRSWAK